MDTNKPTVDKLPTYADTIAELQTSEPKLATELAGFHGIDHVLTWMQQHDLSRNPVDMVAMDEFEYDFALAWSEGKWLVFGVT